MSNMNEALIAEFKQEAASTRKMLLRVPIENSDYKPHAKSMAMGRLAGHLAELPAWVNMVLNTDELDFAKWDYKPFVPESIEALLAFFDDNVQKAIDSLQHATVEQMTGDWSMRHGAQIFLTMPRVSIVRSYAVNHLIHHRGQLSVYLRLNDIPVPGIYGPSADER